MNETRVFDADLHEDGTTAAAGRCSVHDDGSVRAVRRPGPVRAR
ncbi:hypothetical protein [Nocardioides dongxiaopingii]|jgi:hypothetical protein|nr:MULTISPECIES: hypothetical protein [Nocardioides]